MGEDKPLRGRVTRRAFLWASASLLGTAAAQAWRRWRPAATAAIQGSIIGPSVELGHKLRAGAFPPVTGVPERTTIAIIGGGMSGLSAAWKLERSGLKDFRVLELEESPGGNSRWGEGAAGAYPWGAHYLPFPQPESLAVSELLRELKVELGRDAGGRPVYDDRYVCFAPQERLFLHGRWQEGLFPMLGSAPDDRDQRSRFDRLMSAYRRRRGSDGRRAFALPMESSSRDPELLALDGISMAQFLRQEGFTSKRLRWYVEYACRDDFGALLEETSAWAGVHYFAARGEGPEDQVLTWPEGNGWLAKRLALVAGGRVTPRALTFRVAPVEDGVDIDWLDTGTGKARRLKARAALICLPQFVTSRIVEPRRREPPAWLDAFHYTPWVVANLTLDDPPSGRGAAPSWDNVIYDNRSLGYVDAAHQSLSQDRRRAVWTYYRPLTGKDPHRARAEALATNWESWKNETLRDLKRAIPDIEEHVRRLDVMIWGHGMVQPRTRFLWGGERQAAAKPRGRIFFGHSDLSGFSLFEEAQYRGVKAAQDAMELLGHRFIAST